MFRLERPFPSARPFAYAACVLAVMAAAAAVRFLFLDSVPPGFYRDEASNGFDAWCLLHTARDRYGTFLPLHFRAFDDWRECIFNYSLVPFVWLMGLSVGAVRAGAAFWGVLTVGGVLFFGRMLYSRAAVLAAGLVLALMPWHIYLSRFGVRAITGPFFAVAAAGCFFAWASGRGSKRAYLSLFSGAAFLALGFYTYTTMKLFLPLMALGLLAVHAGAFTRRDGLPLLFGAGLFILLVSPIAAEVVFGSTQARFDRISVFSAAATWKDTFFLFCSNYAAHFSPGFLFHNERLLCWMPDGNGLLFYSLIPLLAAFVGRLACGRSRRDAFVALWLLLAPVPAALTVESIPHPIRTLAAVPAVALACGAGFAWVAGLVRAQGRPVWLRAGVGVLICCWGLAFTAESSRFLSYYFGRYRHEALNHFQYGYAEMVDFVRSREADFERIVFHAPYNSDYYRRPFIFYAFHSGIEPELFHGSLDGMVYEKGLVTRFMDKFIVDVSRGHDREHADGTLFVGMGDRDYSDIPGAELIKTVRRPDGKDAFRIYAISLPQESEGPEDGAADGDGAGDAGAD